MAVRWALRQTVRWSVPPGTVHRTTLPARNEPLSRGTDSLNHHFRTATPVLTLDPAALPIRDRAVLRILHRAEAATAAQLTVLAYGHRRIANRRLLQMWQAGLLERTALARTVPYGSGPFAYRLSDAARRRVGGRLHRRGSAYLRHTLDTVEVVTRLVATSPPSAPIVQAWLPESLARDLLPGDIRPDSLSVLRGQSGASLTWVEVDEGTQHQAVMRAKLAAYQRGLRDGHGLVLFVVMTPARLEWLRRTAALDSEPMPWAWATTLDQLTHGLDATLTDIPDGKMVKLDDLLTHPLKAAGPAVGSAEWRELLGSGGGEHITLVGDRSHGTERGCARAVPTQG